MKKTTFLLLLILPLFAIKCFKKEDIEALINIQNNTNKDLYCIPSYIYPDSSLTFTNKEVILANENTYLVKTGESKKIGQIPLCNIDSWNKNVQQGKLIIFYFEKSIIQNNNWTDIKQKNMFYKKVIYKYEDLKDCKLIIN